MLPSLPALLQKALSARWTASNSAWATRQQRDLRTIKLIRLSASCRTWDLPMKSVSFCRAHDPNTDGNLSWPRCWAARSKRDELYAALPNKSMPSFGSAICKDSTRISDYSTRRGNIAAERLF